MKHTLTIARRYLAVLVVALSLSAYGCGDAGTVDPTVNPTVNPVIELSSLTVAPGTLQPAFNQATTDYTVDLSSAIASVTVQAQAAVSGDTVSINGQARTSLPIDLGDPGSTTPVSIVVSESSSNSKTYRVLLKRAGLAGNNSLQNLSVSPEPLDTSFDANLQSYTVTVANTVTSVAVTPTLEDSAATMTVNGQTATSGVARTIALNGPGQPTTITIVATAQNGTPKTYLVTVSRGVSGNNNLRSLTVSPGRLDDPFNAGIIVYTVNVASNVTSIVVTPALQDTTASMSISVSGGQSTNINSGQARSITLRGPGLSTVINIVVTAQNGTRKTYSVDIFRAALSGNNNLKGLTVSADDLDPSFRADRLSYTVSVGSTVTSVIVTATKADPNAVISGDVPNQGQATIQLDGPGTTKTVSIIVAAPNGSSKTYRITVNRAALGSNNNLSALSVTAGGVAQSLDIKADPPPYTVNVASTVTSVIVTATKADPNAVISGDVPNQGQATIQLDGPGTTKTVSIIVTAPNGSSKTYTIAVTRAAPAAPPKPARAPDLIAQDDSCPLFEPPDPLDPNKCAAGSRSDNITKVPQPRFRVAPLQTGQTPNLYVDGVKVKEGFDPGTDTLTPPTPMKEGNREVTSTVKNAAGVESLPSDPLPVTIDTGIGAVPP